MAKTGDIEDDVTRRESVSKTARRAREELDSEAAERPDVSAPALGTAMRGEDQSLTERESTLSIKRINAERG